MSNALRMTVCGHVIRTVNTAMTMVAIMNELDARNLRRGGGSASSIRVP